MSRPARPLSPSRPAEDWTATEPWVRLGTRTCIWLVGGFLVASALLSISAAVVAAGKVTVETSYQSVQHREGGIVEEILVRNGEDVRKGQPLIRLEPTEAEANMKILEGRIRDLAIQRARLLAEQSRAGTFELPAGLDAADPGVAAALATQRSLFAARYAARTGEVAMLKERLAQLTQQLAGLEAQLASTRSEAEINANELASVLPLYKRGYVSLPRLSPLQREEARLKGEVGRLEAEIGKIRSGVEESQLRLAQSDKELQREVADELAKVEGQLNEQREAQRKFVDILERSIIRAPRDGRVHALAVHTLGGVVAPGGKVLEIIPTGERMVVEAKVAPSDMDRVRTGLKATVRFPAFDARLTPRLEGTVTRVSPAEETDQQGRAYFTAEIDVAAEQLALIGSTHKLLPGMPAEVMIETRSHSILSYLVKPLTDVVVHAFREH